MNLTKEEKMSNMKDIREGYTNLLKKEEEIEQLAQKRNLICDPCEKNSKNRNMLGAMIPYCVECGCILVAKVRSPEAQCPLKKW